MTSLRLIPLWIKRTSTIAMVAGLVFATVAISMGAGKLSTHRVSPVVSYVSKPTTIPAIEKSIAAGHDHKAESTTPPVIEVSIQLPQLHVVMMEVTAYCPCTKCCGPKAHGVTASGKLISYNGGKFVAADVKKLPFGTKLIIPGYANGESVEVLDKGGAIKGNKLDLFFPTHAEALKWGRKMIPVTVIE